MTSLRNLPITAALAAALGLAGVSPALAQSNNNTQMQQQQQQQSVDVDDKDLQAYANAAVEIQRIDREYSAELQAAETAEDQQTVRQEAQAEMVEAIEEEGISVQTYNEVVAAARADPEVAAQIRQYMSQTQ